MSSCSIHPPCVFADGIEEYQARHLKGNGNRRSIALANGNSASHHIIGVQEPVNDFTAPSQSHQNIVFDGRTESGNVNPGN